MLPRKHQHFLSEDNEIQIPCDICNITHYNVHHPTYNYQACKEAGKMTHKQEGGNHIIEISPEMTEMVASLDRDFKIMIRKMLKDLKKNMNIYGEPKGKY